MKQRAALLEDPLTIWYRIVGHAACVFANERLGCFIKIIRLMTQSEERHALTR